MFSNIMDNQHIHVKARDKGTFYKAIDLAFEVQDCDGATGYYVDPKGGFVFIWWVKSDNPKHQMFPFTMKAQQAADFAWQWLQTLKKEDWERLSVNEVYGDDVDSEEGLEIYTDEDWGHVNDDSAGICGIRPYWAWLGK